MDSLKCMKFYYEITKVIVFLKDRLKYKVSFFLVVVQYFKIRFVLYRPTTNCKIMCYSFETIIPTKTLFELKNCRFRNLAFNFITV